VGKEIATGHTPHSRQQNQKRHVCCTRRRIKARSLFRNKAQNIPCGKSVGQWNRDWKTHRNQCHRRRAHVVFSVCRIVCFAVCRVNHSAARHTCPASEKDRMSWGKNRERKLRLARSTRMGATWIQRKPRRNSSSAHAGLDGPQQNAGSFKHGCCRSVFFPHNPTSHNTSRGGEGSPSFAGSACVRDGIRLRFSASPLAKYSAQPRN